MLTNFSTLNILSHIFSARRIFLFVRTQKGEEVSEGEALSLCAAIFGFHSGREKKEMLTFGGYNYGKNVKEFFRCNLSENNSRQIR